MILYCDQWNCHQYISPEGTHEAIVLMLLDDETFSTKNIKGNLVNRTTPVILLLTFLFRRPKAHHFFIIRAMQVQEQHTELPHKKQYTAPYYKPQ
jgi:transposase